MRNKKGLPPKTGGDTKLKVKERSELMDFLLSKMGGMSRSSVKSLLAHRQVYVNGKIETLFNLELKPNDIITVSSARGNTELVHPRLKIIYEDQYLIVVEKKEGLLTVSTGKNDETTAFSILKTHVKKSSPRNRIYVVHRLDRETSGVIMFAKSRDVQLFLQENWHRIVTKRVYVALVEGMVEKESDTIVSWLTENEKSLKIHSSSVDNGGQQAVTHYRRVKANDKYSLLEIELETGRKNQIRVHMQGIDHPIVGDRKYGSDDLTLGRVGLHARILAFIHPESRKEVKFETAVPRSFLSVFH
ncbi:MAG: pseudouridine synthase, RluA family [Bacteroidetes bacterium]|nr:pseudouridine synthase, RluA family [Bacteroidota bacterium]